jgi:hypothetical protein
MWPVAFAPVRPCRDECSGRRLLRTIHAIGFCDTLEVIRVRRHTDTKHTSAYGSAVFELIRWSSTGATPVARRMCPVRQAQSIYRGYSLPFRPVCEHTLMA